MQRDGQTSGWGGVSSPNDGRDWPAAGYTFQSGRSLTLEPRLVNCSPNLGRVSRGRGVELRAPGCAPAPSSGTGRVPRSGPHFALTECIVCH